MATRNLITAMTDSVNSTINGYDASTDKLMFNNYGTIATMTRTSNNFMHGLDGVTGIPALNDRSRGGHVTGSVIGGALITPRHILTSRHDQGAVGDVFYFWDLDNNYYSRTAVGLGNAGVAYSHGFGDYAIITLDSDLPAEITPLKVFPKDLYSYFKSEDITGVYNMFYPSTETLFFSTDQEEKSLVHKMSRLSFGSEMTEDTSPNSLVQNPPFSGFVVYDDPTDANALAWREGLITGDSGSPFFANIDNELVFIGVAFTPGSFYGIISENVYNDINILIDLADANATANGTSTNTGYTLTDYDMSGFTQYFSDGTANPRFIPKSTPTVSLSTYKSNRVGLCMDSLNLKQFSRTYAGNFSFNFITALSGTVDFQNKNYTDFYLTNSNTLDKFIEFKSERLKPKSIYSSLQFSKCTGGGNYLKFVKNIRPSFFKDDDSFVNLQFYGATGFSNNQNDSSNLFNIEFIDDFYCSVSYVDNNKKYYLVASDDPEAEGIIPVLFVRDNKLKEESRKIEYILTRAGSVQYLTFIVKKGSKKYILRKQDDVLVGRAIDKFENINYFYINGTSAKIIFNQNTLISNPINTSFIEYTDTEYLANTNKSSFDIESNYLFYKNSSVGSSNFNLINLKNIADTADSFTSSNNLLSSNTDLVFNDNIRNYTSIFNDINAEEDASLELNFVTYNLSYKITPGSTSFTAPSSLNPFGKLNINDTKFVESGSFAFPYPYFADKVHKKLDNIPVTEGQYLCTWLSGMPGEAGIWVDRYYYPDLVSKATALGSKPIYNVTYDDAIENLIESNTKLKTSVTEKLFFDKLSDLTFEPEKEYIYERVKNIEKVDEELQLKYCDLKNQERNAPNYYKTINTNGGYTLAFKFFSNDFSIKSHVNEIDAGFSIVKTGTILELQFKFFDNASTLYKTFTKTIKLSELTNNDLYISFNNSTGLGTVYLNTIEVFTYNLLSFQFTNKQILFGDISLTSEDFSGDILLSNISNNNAISDLFLSLQPVSTQDLIISIFTRSIKTIDDIYISLPCGMRNYTDNIDTLNTLGANLKSKSNVVDINIDNLNITDLNILNQVKDNLLAGIQKSLPATTVINKINFKNFK